MLAQFSLVGLLMVFALASLASYVRISRLLVVAVFALATTASVIYSNHATASNYNPSRAVNSVFTVVDQEAMVRDYFIKQADPHRLKVEHRESKVPNAIVKAAKATGTDPNMLATFANIESTMNAKAKNGRVKGLLQFTPGTWKLMVKRHAKKHGIKHPDIYNAYHNALFGAELINDNSAWLEAKLKRETTVEEKYMAHFISPYYVLKVIKAGGWRPAKDLMPASFVNGNRNYFYSKKGRALTVREFRRAISDKLTTNYMEITHPERVAAISIETCAAPTVVEPHPSPKRHIVTGCASDLWGDRRRSYGVV